MGIWVSTFWLLWIMLLWTFVPKFFFKHIFSFLWGYSPKSRIAGSYDNSMFPDYFQSGCVILHSHKQLLRILVSPYSCQHFLLSAVLIIAILMGMKWYLIIILICMALMSSDIVQLSCAWRPFIYLLWRSIYLDLLPMFDCFAFLI